MLIYVDIVYIFIVESELELPLIIKLQAIPKTKLIIYLKLTYFIAYLNIRRISHM